MSIENLVVTLNRIPKIDAVVESGPDYVTIGSFLATIVIVVVGAIYNGYVLKKTLSSQESISDRTVRNVREQSQAEAVARSRQDWINSLRDAVASFLAAGHEVTASSEKLHNRTGVIPESQEDVLRSLELYDRLYSEFTSSLTTARLHYAKVQLYTNPTEKETGELIAAMTNYINAATIRNPTAELGNLVVGVAQQIIKNEWVRVKTMKL